MKYILLILSFSLAFHSFCRAQPQNHRTDKRILVDSVAREYIVHVPGSYTGQEAVPVVIMFHGTTGTGDKFWRISKWKEKAEQENFIAVFPTALKYCYIKQLTGQQKRATKWVSTNIEATACPGQNLKDDVKFIDAMLDELENDYNIDKDRIYACGFSNGANFVASKLATQLNHRLAAVAFTGAWLRFPEKVDGDPIPAAAMMGENDTKWMEANGGIPVPTDLQSFLADTTVTQRLDALLETFQMQNIYSHKKTNIHLSLRYSDEISGPQRELLVSVVEDMAHVFPNGGNNPRGVVGANVFWDFFMLHSK